MISVFLFNSRDPLGFPCVYLYVGMRNGTNN